MTKFDVIGFAKKNNKSTHQIHRNSEQTIQNKTVIKNEINKDILSVIEKMKTKMNYSFTIEEFQKTALNFNNISHMIFADEKELIARCENAEIVDFISISRDFITLLLQERFKNDSIFKNTTEMLEYWQLRIASLKYETFIVLFIDSQDKLISHHESSNGFTKKVLIDFKEIITKAIKISTSSIILLHNHPSGNVTPSKSDIEITHKIIELMSSIEIDVYDHIVISQTDSFSFKKNYLI